MSFSILNCLLIAQNQSLKIFRKAPPRCTSCFYESLTQSKNSRSLWLPFTVRSMIFLSIVQSTGFIRVWCGSCFSCGGFVQLPNLSNFLYSAVNSECWRNVRWPHCVSQLPFLSSSLMRLYVPPMNSFLEIIPKEQIPQLNKLSLSIHSLCHIRQSSLFRFPICLQLKVSWPCSASWSGRLLFCALGRDVNS